MKTTNNMKTYVYVNSYPFEKQDWEEDFLKLQKEKMKKLRAMLERHEKEKQALHDEYEKLFKSIMNK